jgi:hypothetical protein
METLDERRPIAPRSLQRVGQAIEGSILAEKEDLVLAAEVVIQVARGQIGRERDVAHASGRETAVAEDTCGSLQDVEPAALSAT